ncbi:MULTISPECIES: DUF3307 domain-containing protein [Metabacillus]|uniref:DUF3307 domain-containing protein n=2 Tax=Metabacillus indicus TaxID=246786 RepID=A0A084H4F5_METID|nr:MULTISPECIES: DUF3307 domain-containing protein [Metabacillus]KEZ54467.1 hypothetical protein GS18_0206040 [Metabacillus indicus]
MIVLSLILAHLTADFLLQTDAMVREKRKYLRKHLLHHTLLLLPVLLCFWLTEFEMANPVKNVVLPLVFIIATHGVIDFLKLKLLDGTTDKQNMKNLFYFLGDQFLHLAMIVLGCSFFLNVSFSAIAEKGITLITEKSSLSVPNALLFIAIILIVTTSVSGHVIRMVLGTLPAQLLSFEGRYAFKNERKEDKMNAAGGLTEEYTYFTFNKHDLSRGKLIGYIERLLVLILTFYSAYPAIGFIVTAKSIARFKQMDDRNWAEYFLLGTLTSMFVGIALGLLLREVLL